MNVRRYVRSVKCCAYVSIVIPFYIGSTCGNAEGLKVEVIEAELISDLPSFSILYRRITIRRGVVDLACSQFDVIVAVIQVINEAAFGNLAVFVCVDYCFFGLTKVEVVIDLCDLINSVESFCGLEYYDYSPCPCTESVRFAVGDDNACAFGRVIVEVGYPEVLCIFGDDLGIFGVIGFGRLFSLINLNLRNHYPVAAAHHTVLNISALNRFIKSKLNVGRSYRFVFGRRYGGNRFAPVFTVSRNINRNRRRNRNAGIIIELRDAVDYELIHPIAAAKVNRDPRIAVCNVIGAIFMEACKFGRAVACVMSGLFAVGKRYASLIGVIDGFVFIPSPGINLQSAV